MSATDEAVAENSGNAPAQAGAFCVGRSAIANMIAVKGRTGFALLKRCRFQLQLQDAALAVD
jgi:hypothetical protein